MVAMDAKNQKKRKRTSTQIHPHLYAHCHIDDYFLPDLLDDISMGTVATLYFVMGRFSFIDLYCRLLSLY